MDAQINRTLITAPRAETAVHKTTRCVRAARTEERPTGRVRRVQVKPHGGEWMEEEREETETVFVPAVYEETESPRAVWVVETVPLSPRAVLTTLPDDWPAAERHEFTTREDAENFYRARIRTNPDLAAIIGGDQQEV